jgi:thiol-disulfide isomerase/thioredoxin
MAMKRAVPILLCALTIGLMLPGGFGQFPVRAGDEKKIDMESVKMKDLLTRIGAQKGKVVVIDLWGMFCVPCKREFHNLVRLHNTYAKDGLVCMSLNLDEIPDLKKQAPGFLKEKKAVFSNFWLEEGIDGAQKQWKFEPIPVVVVYARDGKLAKVFNNDDPNKDSFTYKEVEEFLKTKLAEK